jgi:hypothetical protein
MRRIQQSRCHAELCAEWPEEDEDEVALGALEVRAQVVK